MVWKVGYCCHKHSLTFWPGVVRCEGASPGCILVKGAASTNLWGLTTRMALENLQLVLLLDLCCCLRCFFLGLFVLFTQCSKSNREFLNVKGIFFKVFRYRKVFCWMPEVYCVQFCPGFSLSGFLEFWARPVFDLEAPLGWWVWLFPVLCVWMHVCTNTHTDTPLSVPPTQSIRWFADSMYTRILVTFVY